VVDELCTEPTAIMIL